MRGWVGAALGGWGDFVDWVVAAGARPGVAQFSLTERRPFQDLALKPGRQTAAHDRERFDVDHCFSVAVEGVEVGWVVIVGVDLDCEAVEAADFRHPLVGLLGGGRFLGMRGR